MDIFCEQPIHLLPILSKLIRDTMQIAAVSDSSGVVVSDQHIKISPNSKAGSEGGCLLFERDKAVRQNNVF